MANDGYKVVVGLGKSGLACARFLLSQGARVAVTDSRAEPPNIAKARKALPGVTFALGGFDQALLTGAAEIVISPGVDPELPALRAAREAGVPIVSEIELFARASRAPAIGITGSNGKSTVTTVLGLMAERAGLDVGVGGNLGTPALELLREPEPALYVLELSSFQLEATFTLKPRAGVVLNLSEDHLDRYDSMAGYGAAKARVYHDAEVKVINADDPAVVAMVEPGEDVVPFSLRGRCEAGYGIAAHAGEEWIHRRGEPLMPARELRLPGRHNLANALAALALGEAAGLPFDAMRAVLREFAGLPHRTQWVGETGGVTWYDDSKGTNVGATLAAVQGWDGRLVLIAGGDGKGQDFSPLRAPLTEKGRAVVLIGRDAPILERALAGALPLHRAADMDEAVRIAHAEARPGDAVLLSPACASLDMFRNYAHRGDVFAEAVRRLAS